MSSPEDLSTALDSGAETNVRPPESRESSAARFTPGTLLSGRYRIVAPLGKGGMGEIYRADDTRLDQPVALKFLPEALAADSDRLNRLVDEVRIGRQISHPNVCRLYDIAEAEGHHFLVMEYVDGEDLGSLLRRIGRLPGDKALEIARDICAGLSAAHDKGVIHRDLKPANVMIDGNGRARLADFGLAALEHSGATRDMSGTPQYMAPEQLRGERASLRSDVFALGLVFHEILTGKRVFVAKSLDELRALHDLADPPGLSSGSSDIDPQFERVILRCLARDPNDRPASARALASDLEALRSGLTDASAARVPTGTVPLLEATPRWSFRSRGLALAAALALTAAMWAGFRPSRGSVDSLAVLPFENASEDPDAEYLGDGLTESLINQMSRVPSLKVMARTTVFSFRGTADPREAGRKLGVGAVLTGRVTRRGSQLSISAELTEVSTGVLLWGEKYDRPVADLLVVQDSIASEIADGLRLRLSGEEKRTLDRRGTDNPEAYELSLKAHFLVARNTEEDILEARRLYQQAARLDPRFVEAHLGAAATYGMTAVDGLEPPQDAWLRLEEEARKALEIEPGNVHARCSLALRQFFFDWDWAGSGRQLEALSREPRILLGEQFRAIGLYLWARGRGDEAAALMERALRADPRNPGLKNMLGNYLAQAGRIEEAIASYQAALDADSSDPRPLFGMAEMLRRRGDIRGAIEARRRAYELAGEEDGVRALGAAKTEKDYRAAETAIVRSRLVALQARAREHYVSPLDLARLYSQVGERETAFVHLGKAIAERSAGLVFLKVEHAWDPIRDDARFASIVRRVGIP